MQPIICTIQKLFKSLLLLICCLFFQTTNLFGQSLELQKFVDKTTVTPTEIFTYTLQYRCAGTASFCNGMMITDALPPGVEFVGMQGSVHTTNESYDPATRTVTFTFISPLESGSTAEVKITVRFPSGTANGTQAVNTATINASNAPSITSNPVTTTTGGATTTLTGVDKYSTLTTKVAEDGTADFTIEFCNPTTGVNMTNVSVTDPLPAGTQFVWAGTGGTYNAGTNTVTWNLANMDPGDCYYLHLVLLYPNANFNVGDVSTNTATINYTPAGGSPQSIGASGSVTVTAPDPRFWVSKTGPSSIRPGENGLYVIKGANTGTEALPGFSIEDVIPAGITVTSFSTGAWYLPGNVNIGVTVKYTTNLNSTPTTVPGSPFNRGINTYIGTSSLGLASGEYITKLIWEFGPDPFPVGGFNWDAIGVNFTVNSDLAPGTQLNNCLTCHVTTAPDGGPGGPGGDPGSGSPFVLEGTKCKTTEIIPLSAGNGLYIFKSVKTGYGPYSPGDVITFDIVVGNPSVYQTAVNSPVVYDLLPPEVTYVAGSQTYTDQGSGAPTPTFTQIDNFNGTGRTLLKWEWPGYDLMPGKEFKVSYDVTIGNAVIGGVGSFENTAQTTGSNLMECNVGNTPDTYDFDGDGNTTETFCNAVAPVNIAELAALESAKWVKGQASLPFINTINGDPCPSLDGYTRYPCVAQTTPGGTADYRLYITNPGTIPMTNVVVIDILPIVGDAGVIDLSPRGSQWRPVLVGPVDAPAGVTVYYSTESNPCRSAEGIEPSGPAGCIPPNWSTVPPTNITTVKSLKFDFGDIVINPGDELLLEWPMRAPLNVPTNGEIAWNSFGYIANKVNTDGTVGDPLLPAEPLKVGIATHPLEPAAYGNYVWLDTNQNGLQDVTETGVQGVRVELFLDNGDGISDPNTDTYVSFTLTDAAGYYVFSNLPPGNYFAVFFPPTNHNVTIPNVPADPTDTLDSDGTLYGGTYLGTNVYVTSVTELTSGEIDLSWDLGLYQTVNASLGNYVWNDLNQDGIQNESAADGLNGVTVYLYAAGDLTNPIDSTVTANDINGNPGYYLFTDLTPGDYVLQFELPNIAGATFTTLDAGGNDITDSDANITTGFTTTITLSPNEIDLTWDAGVYIPQGNLSLGNVVWEDLNNSGTIDGIETGINGVTVDLYADTNGNGVYDAGDTYITSVTTATIGGQDGVYLFTNLTPGDYIVVLPQSNFASGQPLNGYISSTGNNDTANPGADSTNDPDNNVNSNDDGMLAAGVGIVSQAITLTAGTEPITDGDTDANSNLTVDFGLFQFTCNTPTAALIPDSTMCNVNGTVLDLQGLIVSGNTSGTWTDTDNTGGLVGTIFTYQTSMGAGPFIFTYTIAGVVGCNNNVYTTTINANSCTTPCSTPGCIELNLLRKK